MNFSPSSYYVILKFSVDIKSTLAYDSLSQK